MEFRKHKLSKKAKVKRQKDSNEIKAGVYSCLFVVNLKKQTVRQVKLVQFSRFESCPAKVSRPAGM